MKNTLRILSVGLLCGLCFSCNNSDNSVTPGSGAQPTTTPQNPPAPKPQANPPTGGRGTNPVVPPPPVTPVAPTQPTTSATTLEGTWITGCEKLSGIWFIDVKYGKRVLTVSGDVAYSKVEVYQDAACQKPEVKEDSREEWAQITVGEADSEGRMSLDSVVSVANSAKTAQYYNIVMISGDTLTMGDRVSIAAKRPTVVNKIVYTKQLNEDSIPPLPSTSAALPSTPVSPVMPGEPVAPSEPVAAGATVLEGTWATACEKLSGFLFIDVKYGIRYFTVSGTTSYSMVEVFKDSACQKPESKKVTQEEWGQVVVGLTDPDGRTELDSSIMVAGSEKATQYYGLFEITGDSLTMGDRSTVEKKRPSELDKKIVYTRLSSEEAIPTKPN